MAITETASAATAMGITYATAMMPTMLSATVMRAGRQAIANAPTGATGATATETVPRHQTVMLCIFSRAMPGHVPKRKDAEREHRKT